MKYNYYRCENCKALVTVSQIKEKGKCSKCGKGRITPAYFCGYNIPKPWEWPLIWMGIR